MKGWQVGVVIVLLAALVAIGVYRSRQRQPAAPAAPEQPAAAGTQDVKARTTASLKRAAEFQKNSQNADGSWGKQPSVGVTAMILHSLLISPLGLTADNTPAIRKGLEYVVGNAKESGEVSTPGLAYGNYETALAILALKSAKKPEYREVMRKAAEFVKSKQFSERDGVQPSDAKYGGFGYGGKHDRPDLSNTQWAVEALGELGVSETDPAFQRALAFVRRCQNNSEVNDQQFAAVVNDGGAVYSPAAAGGEDDPVSKAGKIERGGLVGWRSYGMTYAMLKSYIYLGLKPDSPEVRTALDWISHNWTVTENPGLGKSGKFYYLTTFSKTLHLLGDNTVKDADGNVHKWANELAEHLLAIQREDGSWVNDADKWWEGDPALVTGYALRALSYAWPHLE